MSVQLGSQQLSGFRFETVRNTAELTPNITLKLTECDFNLDPGATEDKIQYGSRDNIFNTRYTKREVSGKIKGMINTKDIGFLLKMAMAQPTSVTALGATTHTFRPHNQTGGVNNVNLPSFTYFYTKGAFGIFKARGCVVDKITLTVGETETTFEADIKALDLVEVTNGTEKTNIMSALVITEPDPILNFGNVVVKYADTFAGLSAGTILNVLPDIKIEINNMAKYDSSSSSAPLAVATNFNVGAGGFESSVELSFYAKTENKPLFDAFLSNLITNQEKAFEIKLENQSYGVLGTSTLFNSLTFQIPRALPVMEISTPIDDYIQATIKLEKLRNPPAQGFSIQSILTNTTATY